MQPSSRVMDTDASEWQYISREPRKGQRSGSTPENAELCACSQLYGRHLPGAHSEHGQCETPRSWMFDHFSTYVDVENRQSSEKHLPPPLAKQRAQRWYDLLGREHITDPAVGVER